MPPIRSQIIKIGSLNFSNNAKPLLADSDVIRERILSFESEKVPDSDDSSQGSFDETLEEGI